jgi:membrane-bound lytic murein transglycosylase B
MDGEGFIGYQTERAELRMKVDTQEALLALGYAIGDIDGVIGSKTRQAIRDFQKSQKLKAPRQTSPKLVEQMRSVALERGLIRPGSAGGTAP